MQLKEIISQTNQNFAGLENLQVSGISRESRTVENGNIYFCLTKDYDKAKLRCKEAIENGAILVVSEFDLDIDKNIEVSDVRDLFARCCANYYKRACDELTIIGVTGTNGKTTISRLIATMLERNGKKVGLIGTNGVFYDEKTFDCPLTTPDADFLHKTFFDMRNCGVEYVVMEVSAHAIEQKRINGINFELGVLSNITQDHLDYFKTFENYEKTKLSFISSKYIKKGIVCADDDCAKKVIENADVPIFSYGLKNPSDIFAIDINYSMEGTHFVGNVCDKVVEIKTDLVGQYNVYNSLASLGICSCLGFDEKQLTKGLNFATAVEGRFNVLNKGGKYIIIDFAHSPDSLMNVLKTIKMLTNQKVYLVFGCGGNRDKTKRQQMGRIAEEYADYVCLTDDNPRLENSMDIIADIEKGMTKPHFVQTNRSEAIRMIVSMANAGDVVLIAGKGAEKYQEIGTVKKLYSDFEEVNKIFE